MSPVFALWGRHWQRWGLKHTAGVGNGSRTRDRLRRMRDRDNRREASTLRIVSRRSLSDPTAPDPKWDGDQARWVLTVCRHTRGIPRCTEASYVPLEVQTVKRGKPDSLSEAVQGVSPRSRPNASEGKGGAGKRCGRKRMSLGNGVDRGSTFAPPERELTSCRCDRTKKTKQTVNRGSVSNE